LGAKFFRRALYLITSPARAVQQRRQLLANAARLARRS